MGSTSFIWKSSGERNYKTQTTEASLAPSLLLDRVDRRVYDAIVERKVKVFARHELRRARERFSISATSHSVAAGERCKRTESVEPAGCSAHDRPSFVDQPGCGSPQIARARFHVRACRRGAMRQRRNEFSASRAERSVEVGQRGHCPLRCR